MAKLPEAVVMGGSEVCMTNMAIGVLFLKKKKINVKLMLFNAMYIHSNRARSGKTS